MADGPVQVVLNPSITREPRQPQRGRGPGKDFYAGLDAEFSRHREAVASSLGAILSYIRVGDLVNIAVKMRPDALAKSHRPFSALFTQARAAHVGTASYGELVFSLNGTGLTQVLEAVNNAETEVEWREVGGVLTPRPSRQRTEVGAIDQVRRWLPSEERGFSLDQAEAWLEVGGTAAAVEFFDVPDRPELRIVIERERTMVKTLALEAGDIFRIEGEPTSHISDETDGGPVMALRAGAGRTFRTVLAQFESSAAVKKVRLDDRLPSSPPSLGASSSEQPPALSEQADHGGARAAVGVIDGGVRGVFENSDRVIGRAGLLAPEHRGLDEVDHGTMIASLVAHGGLLNGSFLHAAEDCDVYDLDLFPAREHRSIYYRSLDDFLSELRESVRRAHDDFGVRVFNLSYNMERAPGNFPYSGVASGLDEIAIELDVIFVVSAGNLKAEEERPEWPENPDSAISMLASYNLEDGIFPPAESLANVSVGAVNPGFSFGRVEHAPSAYTRRGVHTPSAKKPDFAAVGAAGSGANGGADGLVALRASTGQLAGAKGTSFAAPLVARYLASLDAAIATEVSRELVLALASHHARLPRVLNTARLRAIASSFVGYGMLPSVDETLTGNPHQMTIILADTIRPRMRAEFRFRWPQSLVDAKGKCRGRMSLTLATQPIIEPVHGSELVRINLEAYVRQSDGNEKFENRAVPAHEFFSGYRYANERTLATELGKWYPLKSYRCDLHGKGKSADWRLDIDYLTRANEYPPPDGVRFAAVLTVEDPSGQAPVFEEMRASLTEIGVQLSDLRTAINVGIATQN